MKDEVRIKLIEKLAQDLRFNHFHTIGAGLLAEKLVDLNYRQVSPERLTVLKSLNFHRFNEFESAIAQAQLAYTIEELKG